MNYLVSSVEDQIQDKTQELAEIKQQHRELESELKTANAKLTKVPR